MDKWEWIARQLAKDLVKDWEKAEELLELYSNAYDLINS